METYQIEFAPDGLTWQRDPKKYKDPTEAVRLVQEFKTFDPFARVKVLNSKTGYIIYQAHGDKAPAINTEVKEL